MHAEDLADRFGDALVTDQETRALAEGVLTDSGVGYLAMQDAGGPYVLPTSFAYDEGVVHLHGGPGKKAQALGGEPRVCLSVCTTPELILADNPCSDNFRYRSVLVFGSVRQVQDEAEREASLRAIIAKYHPDRVADRLGSATLAKTLVYRLDVEALTYRQHPAD